MMRGRVVSGTGSASKSLSLFFGAWAKARGICLFPGTLNLEPFGEAVLPDEGIDLSPWMHKAPNAGRLPKLEPTAWPVTIRDIRCFAFSWSGDLYYGQIEVIAEMHLRTVLELEDGDEIDVWIEEGSYAEIQDDQPVEGQANR